MAVQLVHLVDWEEAACWKPQAEQGQGSHMLHTVEGPREPYSPETVAAQTQA